MGLHHQERVELAQRTADELRRHIEAEKILLFGSVAIGKDDAESDVDIIVVKRGDAPDGDLTFEQVNALYEIYHNLDTSVYPILPTQDDFIHLCCISSQHYDKPPLRQFCQVRKIKKYGQEL
ncbi:MAG: hypothetical protein ACD_40C00092G0002 [uncultured bacterium]|nr:MAG: hypothetical protein ACD_40C00092G0002 [uncultured bacterium]